MKNFFKKVFGTVKKWYEAIFDKFENHASAAVRLVNLVKHVVHSPVVSTIVQLTPTKGDDYLLSRAKLILDSIALKIGVANGIISESESKSQAVAKLIEHLKTLNPEMQDIFWVKLAGDINVALSDDELTLSEAIMITQKYFSEHYQKK